MASLTAIILTKNEEDNIGDCIKSIKNIAERIVLVDSFSTDDTVKIAQDMGAEVVAHAFENYAKQYQYAVDTFQITSTWTLRIDADERLTTASSLELEHLCDENETTEVSGVELRFKKNFLGRDLLHGGVYPWRKMNCYKTRMGKIEQREMDEHIVLSGGKIARMKEDSLHLDRTTVEFFTDKHNWYSSREAMDYINSQGDHADDKMNVRTWIKMKFYYRLPLGMRAHIYYLYRYYIRLGFLDGKPGKIYTFLQAYWYRYLVDAKIYEKEHEKE